MMQPFRLLADASAEWLQELQCAVTSYIGGQGHQHDDSLDDLVRHTMRAEGEEEADAHGIWARLSGRMESPFGGLSVEGPAGNSEPTVVAVTGIAPFPEGPLPKDGQPSPRMSIQPRALGSMAEAVALLR